ncbi:ATP-binding protein [Ferruginibacter sp.]|nr:ATP-binding protein [Ferruginibacter sp.]
MEYKSKGIFKPRARLLLQLGDQLIKNENVAVLELVKNSYDADARNVIIRMTNVHDKKFGRIEILDDGSGMNDDIIQNAWLEPGSDFKENQYKNKELSKLYNRLPIGEKGIGRFGVHKLGEKIELITRQKDKDEFTVDIDWREFAKHKYLEKAEFDVTGRSPQYFLRGRHGTKIVITELRTEWDRRMVRELYKALFTLSSPFKTVDHFTIKFETDKPEWIEDLIDWNEVKDFSLYYFKVKIKGTEITEFIYRFTPWEEMDKIAPKEITVQDQFIQDNQTIEVPSQENKKEKIIINLDKYNIGEVDFEGYIFDRDLKVLNLIEDQKVRQVKKYLDENGGIRVYRDNLRINEYGEKSNDWLSLDLRRVNVPAKRISNNIILSVINLKREDSSSLVEKTNREGFVENEAYNDFKAAILYVIGLVEKLRQVDKAELRDKYSPTEQEEPVLHLTNELKLYIEKNIKEEPVREKVKNYIDDIERDYNEINEILLTSAGAGLTLGVGIHEVEKLVKELVLTAKNEKTTGKVNDLIKDIQTTVNNYLSLLKQNDKDVFEIKNLIESALQNVEYRMKVHGVEVIRAFENYPSNPKLECSRRFFLSGMLNLFDNSIYWLEKKAKGLRKINSSFSKKIYINIVKEKDDRISVLIADNGNGFSLPTSKIVKPFITAKDEGMGLGLHITNQIMKVLEGNLIFPEKGDYELPEDFANGAVIVFQFKTFNS